MEINYALIINRNNYLSESGLHSKKDKTETDIPENSWNKKIKIKK